MTDFGIGPYVGQLQLLASALAPKLQVIDLVNDLPPCCPELAAWLLPALARGMPGGTVYLCVVDPGVGGVRPALALRLGQNWFVGPDNGLLAPLVRGAHASECAVWRIDWRPEIGSDSFHARDLFLPIALALTMGRLIHPCQPLSAQDICGYQGPLEFERIIYVDRYGNLMTGLDAKRARLDSGLLVGDQTLLYARTFCEVPEGTAFWYRNAFGLVEIAANRQRADQLLGLSVGHRVTWAPFRS